jgi:uncharacterized protein DUF3309
LQIDAFEVQELYPSDDRQQGRANARIRPTHQSLHQVRSGIRLSDPADQGGVVITLFIVVLLLLALGSLPAWPYSSGWGYYPSGGFGLILLILIVLALSGRL